MLTVSINEDEVSLPDEATIIDAVTHLTGRELTADGKPVDGGRLGVAVALNATVVPRGKWSATELTGGEELEIVTAVQGG